jgi:serine/threonine protein kinase
LDHKNVVRFFGAIKLNVSHQSDEQKFVFLTKLCQGNLRNVLLENESKVPAKASYTKDAIKTFLNWAIEIADGLNYIHTRGLVHKHLKLENILVGIEFNFTCQYRRALKTRLHRRFLLGFLVRFSPFERCEGVDQL